MSIRDRIDQVKHLQHKHFICVLENPKMLVNTASAIRNISAFGITKLYVIGGDKNFFADFETARNNKNLTKVSVGANKWVFVKYFDTTKQCIDHLNKNVYVSVVTSSHQKGKQNIDLYDGNFTKNRIAVWFGNESKGVSDEAVENAEHCIQIPMGGIVESLNLGTSTGIVLSYISYQRLKHFYKEDKAKFKNKATAREKMKSWRDFINPHREK